MEAWRDREVGLMASMATRSRLSDGVGGCQAPHQSVKDVREPCFSARRQST